MKADVNDLVEGGGEFRDYYEEFISCAAKHSKSICCRYQISITASGAYSLFLGKRARSAFGYVKLRNSEAVNGIVK